MLAYLTVNLERFRLGGVDEATLGEPGLERFLLELVEPSLSLDDEIGASWILCDDDESVLVDGSLCHM